MSIIYSKTQDGTMNVLCAGKVSRDPEIKQGNNGDRVKFSICYGNKQFMDCEAWADSDVGSVAGCLEKGDVIAVMGAHRTWEYNGKQYATLSVEMIFTLAMPMVAPEPAEQATAPSDASPYKELMDDDSGELPF